MDDYEILFLLYLLRRGGIDAEKVLDLAAKRMLSNGEAHPPFPEQLSHERLLSMELFREHSQRMADELRLVDWEPRKLIAPWTDELPVDMRHLLWRKLPFLAWRADDGPGGQRLTAIGPFAQGGLGLIWKAKEEPARRTVLVKQMRPELSDDAGLRHRFLKEGRIGAQLEHPNIVPIYRVVEHEDGTPPYYVMRWIQGRTLEEEIKQFQTGALNEHEWFQRLRELLQNLIQVCEAVSYAHSERVLHRDIKPMNIIVGDFGETHLLDWGLAKLIDDDDEVPSNVSIGNDLGVHETVQGSCIGSPAWMAPEQAIGNPNIDERADVYGLGATLFCILTGLPPNGLGKVFSIKEVIAAAINDPTPHPAKIEPRTPKSLDAICVKALQKETRDRYQSANALIDDLKQWMSNEKISVYREPFTRRLARATVKNPSLSATVAGIAIAVVASALLTLLFSIDAGRSVTWAAMSFMKQRLPEQVRLTNLQLESLEKKMLMLGSFESVKSLLKNKSDDASATAPRYAISRFLDAELAFNQIVLATVDAKGIVEAPWIIQREDSVMEVHRNQLIGYETPWLGQVKRMHGQKQPAPQLLLSKKSDPETGGSTIMTHAICRVDDPDGPLGYVVAEIDLSLLLLNTLGVHPVGGSSLTTAEGKPIFWRNAKALTPAQAERILDQAPDVIDSIRHDRGEVCQTSRYTTFPFGWVVCATSIPYSFGDQAGRFGVVNLVDWALIELPKDVFVIFAASTAGLIGFIVLLSVLIWRFLRSMSGTYR
ncbi:Serine/threonine-protein kinase PknD [Planctomycetes bacterium Pan216]|uniref:Serine/threonine-protein kinase PknD n=1 Tax=Kolteria novifilia TaxID=2527975 RepID=A0A518AYV4_9BACT|nr:Serine/threonine-protein kinase PknD [Planctomycetes bacterium Pan216]